MLSGCFESVPPDERGEGAPHYSAYDFFIQQPAGLTGIRRLPMIYSAKDFGASCRTTAMLAALLLSGLSACGDGNSGATVKGPAVNNKGLWIADGTKPPSPDSLPCPPSVYPPWPFQNLPPP